MKQNRISGFYFYCLTVLTSFCIAFGTAQAEEVDKTQPYQMMKTVSERTFARLKAEKDAVREQPNILKEIVEQELMPYVNYRYAALKVLGPNLKRVKKEDVPEFIEAFHLYLVTSYAQALTLYTDQTVEFEPETPVPEGRRITSIKIDVIDAPRPNIKVEFKLRKDKKSGEWKAFDMIAEGISLLSSKQSEWNGKIRQEGLPAVSEELLRLAAQPVRFEGESK